MDVKKIVIGVLLVFAVLFLVCAGPRWSEEDAGEARKNNEDWKKWFAQLMDDGRSWIPGFLSPAPLCPAELRSSSTICRLDRALDLRSAQSCSWTIRGGSTDQKQGRFVFVGNDQQKLTATTSNSDLLKAVPEYVDGKGDGSEAGALALTLVAMENDDRRAEANLTLKCNVSRCRLAYRVEPPDACD